MSEGLINGFQGDIGSACTSVVTEYRQKKPQHAAPITIEVEYLSQAGIEGMIKELVWSYRKRFLPGVESNQTSEADHAHYVREAEQAWSALEAAFKHQKDFSRQMLRTMSEVAIQEQLAEWTRGMAWPTTGKSGFWTAMATTADECTEKTKVFMEDRYWPFTKMIR